MNSVISKKSAIGALSRIVAISTLMAFGSAANATVIVMDNTDTNFLNITGNWSTSTAVGGFEGLNYAHDQNNGKGNKSFEYLIGQHGDFSVGKWLIEMNWTEYANRASNVLVDVENSLGNFTVDQTSSDGGWFGLGMFDLDSNSLVRIRNANTNGYVIADAFRFISVPEPSILALFGAGLFGLGLARRRKPRQS